MDLVNDIDMGWERKGQEEILLSKKTESIFIYISKILEVLYIYISCPGNPIQSIVKTQLPSDPVLGGGESPGLKGKESRFLGAIVHNE